MDDKYTKICESTVVKANELIQRSRMYLTAQEQKILLYLISQVNSFEAEFKEHDFSISDFCKVAGIDSKSGKNYADIKKTIKGIRDKSIWVQTNEDEEITLSWIDKVRINKKSGIIKIRFDEDMKPYLLQLKSNFTKFELLWTLQFRSKYAIRLYEIIKSVHYYELDDYTKEYNVDELKKLLGAENHKTWTHFETRALDPAVKEINLYSDKNLKYEKIKTGRSVTHIRFTIKTKDPMERIRIANDFYKKIGNPGSISI